MSTAAALLAAVRHNQPKPTWRNLAFDKQRAFIDDPHRLKASWTTRRGAKSYTDGLHFFKDMEETPGCNCLYLGLTRLSAKAIIWKDVLKEINERLGAGAVFNETELTMTIPNGSVLYVAGVDVDENERKKLFGRKYKNCTIDEAALYGIDLYDLVYVTLRPAVTDMRGTIILSGMSSNITHGLFYDVTTGKEKGWSLHNWSAYDNPHVAVQWAEEIAFIKAQQPHLFGSAKFRQAYLNEWVIDDEVKVYRFSEQLNTAPALPAVAGNHSYVLGIDLGHSPDASAFVVGAYSPENRELYYVHAEKRLKMDITDVANKVRELEARWTFDVKVVDNASKQAVAELNNRHKLNLIAAEKAHKPDFINLMNADFQAAVIKALPSTLELQEEWAKLVWETDSGKIKEPRKEHPSLPNHLTDAALYLWRYCHTYLFEAPKQPIDYSAQSRWETEHVKALEESIRMEKNPDEFSLAFEPELFDFSLDDTV